MLIKKGDETRTFIRRKAVGLDVWHTCDGSFSINIFERAKGGGARKNVREKCKKCARSMQKFGIHILKWIYLG